MKGTDWWESQMFDYIYYDGGECQDKGWLEEMKFIAKEFDKAGFGWCLNGQHWKPNNMPCWSDDF